jgi:hypothetical protein
MVAPRWSGEAKYQALLAVAQAANSLRDLSSVLDTEAGALEGLVPIDLIGVITHQPTGIRLRAVYLRSTPRRSDESQAAALIGAIVPSSWTNFGADPATRVRPEPPRLAGWRGAKRAPPPGAR